MAVGAWKLTPLWLCSRSLQNEYFNIGSLGFASNRLGDKKEATAI
jgi:hypothetical protein